VSNDEVLATSDGSLDERGALTFRTSPEFCEGWLMDNWSHPVQVRFFALDDGTYELQARSYLDQLSQMHERNDD
jgi:hypothetical protein